MHSPDPLMRPHRIVASLLIAIVVVLFGGISLRAQAPRARTVTLVGVVRDSTTGEVLPNARVSIGSLSRAAQTNADGRFTMLGVPATAQIVIVQYIGYTTRRLAINADTITAPLVVELAHAIVRLATSNVVGATDAAPTVVAIGREISQLSVSVAQVEAMPSVGEADVFRTLQMLPSVAGAGNGTASLSVRGGKADQNLVLLDGMTVYHVDHFFGLFSAFNTDALKDIQLYAGGFPARYGGRVSSVIDLTGKAGDEHQFRASGGASLLSARGVVEIPLGRGSILFSGRRSYTDVIKSGLYNRLFDFAKSQGTTTALAAPPRGAFGNRFQQQTVDPSFYFYDFNSKATYRPTSKDVATISVYRGLDNLDQSQSLGVGGPGGGGPFGGQGAGTTSTLNDLTIAKNQGVSGRWFRQWSSRFSSDALVASSRYESNSDRTANGGTPNGGPRFNFGFNETNAVSDVTARIDNAFDFASWSRVEFGVWNTHNTVTYNFLIGGTDSTQRGRNTARDGAGTLSAVYAQHTWTPVPKIDLTTGVRANRYDVTAATYVEPRLSAGWQLTPALRLKAAWGRYHQFVNRVENEDVLQGSRDFWLLADTTLKPNASTHAIVGFLFDRPSWALNVEAYDKTLENATLFSRRYRRAFGVNTGSFFFTGDGHSRGLEFLLERKIGTVTGWASYTLAKSTTQFAEVDQGTTFPTSQDQRHELKAFGTMQLRKWDISATGIYGSGRPYTAPISQYQLKLLDGSTQNYINVGDKNGERLPSYQRIDLAVSRTIRTDRLFDWRVGVSLYNVANRRNVSFRKFDLSTDPMTISDVTQLGFTPSIDIKLTRRGLRDPIRGN